APASSPSLPPDEPPDAFAVRHGMPSRPPFPWPRSGGVRVIGLMSGTSLDGVDAALVELPDSAAGFVDGAGEFPWRLEAFVSVPYSAARRDAIHAAIARGDAATLCS